MRMNALSNGATSTSAPEKMRSCPCSVAGVGENRISPRPISTSPVIASFALDGEHGAFGERQPEVFGGDDQVAGGELARRVHASRYSPSTDVSPSPPTIRHEFGGAVRRPAHVEARR